MSGPALVREVLRSRLGEFQGPPLMAAPIHAGRATSRSVISWPPCAFVVCSAYAVFRGLKQRQEIMSATEILKSAFMLALYITVTTTTLATAQEATFSE